MTSAGPPTSSSSTTTTTTDRLTGDSLPLIDLRLLSHSELLSLSTTRNRDNRTITGICGDNDDDDHLLNPKIDRSVFNESAGSRRQTFSRLRLVPRQSAASAPPPPPPPQQVPIEEEDPRVVSLLRQLFRGEGWSQGDGLEEKIEEDDDGDGKLVGFPIDYLASGIGTGSTSMGAGATVEGKRKRGRPRKSTGNNLSYDNRSSALQ